MADHDEPTGNARTPDPDSGADPHDMADFAKYGTLRTASGEILQIGAHANTPVGTIISGDTEENEIAEEDDPYFSDEDTPVEDMGVATGEGFVGAPEDEET